MKWYLTYLRLIEFVTFSNFKSFTALTKKMYWNLVNKRLIFYFYIKRFEKTSVDFDISLIKLKQPINKENAHPICMPKSFVSQDRGAFCMIAG